MSIFSSTSSRADKNNVSHSVLALTVASELAAPRFDVQGTETFLPALIDELYNPTTKKIHPMAKIKLDS